MRNFMFSVLMFAVISLIGGRASAQEVYYPGSVWSSNGTLSPIEKGNVLSMTHAEQGIAYKGAELFGSLTAQADSKRYDWNNRLIEGVGVRFTQSIGSGMVRGTVAYLNEKRYVVPSNTGGVSLSVDCWFGWNHSPKAINPTGLQPVAERR